MADCEESLGNYLLNLKEQNQIPRLHELTRKFESRKVKIPDVHIDKVCGEDYNILLPMFINREANP